MTSLGKAALLVGAGLLAVPGSASSSEQREIGFSATLTGSTDYLFRGYSFTQGEPTANAYVELTYGIAYLAFWTSSINTGSAVDAPPGYGNLGRWEQDLYVGLRPTTGPINWDFGVLWYIYGVQGAGVSTGDYDYVELKASASTSLSDSLTVGLTGYYAPDQNLAIPESTTIEGTVSYALGKVGVFQPTLGATLGYWHVGENSKYLGGYFAETSGALKDSLVYWNAGLRLDVERLFFDFRYWDTNLENEHSDSRFVFSLGIQLAPAP